MKPVIVLICWVYSLQLPSRDIRHSWFSLWDVESPRSVHHCAHLFSQFLASPFTRWEEAKLPAASAVCLGLWFCCCWMWRGRAARLCADKPRWRIVSGGVHGLFNSRGTENPDFFFFFNSSMFQFWAVNPYNNNFKLVCSWWLIWNKCNRPFLCPVGHHSADLLTASLWA